jgi:hypothetical protein
MIDATEYNLALAAEISAGGVARRWTHGADDFEVALERVAQRIPELRAAIDPEATNGPLGRGMD